MLILIILQIEYCGDFLSISENKNVINNNNNKELTYIILNNINFNNNYGTLIYHNYPYKSKLNLYLYIILIDIITLIKIIKMIKLIQNI